MDCPFRRRQEAVAVAARASKTAEDHSGRRGVVSSRIGAKTTEGASSWAPGAMRARPRTTASPSAFLTVTAQRVSSRRAKAAVNGSGFWMMSTAPHSRASRALGREDGVDYSQYRFLRPDGRLAARQLYP